MRNVLNSLNITGTRAVVVKKLKNLTKKIRSNKIKTTIKARTISIKVACKIETVAHAL